MKEFKIIVEIDSSGQIKSETKGFSGPTCINALEELFKDIIEFEKKENTDEFYQKTETNNNLVTVSKRGKYE